MNTANSRPLPRVLIAALSLAGTFATFAMPPSPAEAAPRSGSYSAALVSPLAAPQREILDGVMWRCEGERCSAPADGARSVSVCRNVARTFGTVASFKAPRGELTAEELARCNAGG